MKSKIAIATLALLLTACEPNEMYPAGGAIPFSGEGSSAPAQQAAPVQRLAPMPMLNDPEKEEWITDEEVVLADNLSEAQRKCRELAELRGLNVDSIKPPSRSGGKRYVCKFGGFVEK